MKPVITGVSIAAQSLGRWPSWRVEYRFADVTLALTIACAQDAFDAERQAEVLLAPYDYSKRTPPTVHA